MRRQHIATGVSLLFNSIGEEAANAAAGFDVNVEKYKGEVHLIRQASKIFREL
jgi:hypothetical protein